jgi:SAM-dependent methyltransferase
MEARMFYDSVAEFYDEMTGFSDELLPACKALETFLKRYPAERLLDSACGTGIYAIAASKLGLSATGADLSAKMIEKAEANSIRENVTVDWVTSDLKDLQMSRIEKFDMILCMGNSVPHFLTPGDIGNVFRVWKNLLNPGGVLVVELLNYRKILERNKRVIYVNRKSNKEYIRFYDFIDSQSLRFNVLEIEWKGNEADDHLFSMPLHPYLYDEIIGIGEANGFRADGVFEDLTMSPFEKHNSGIVLIVFISK